MTAPNPDGDDPRAAGHRPLQASSSRSPNPEAPLFTPSPGSGPSRPHGGSPNGLCFNVPTDSVEDEEELLLWSTPRPSVKGKEVAVEARRPPPPRPSGCDASGFMADARRSHPQGGAGGNRAPPSSVAIPRRSTQVTQPGSRSSTLRASHWC